jgi:lipoprotein NlpD
MRRFIICGLMMLLAGCSDDLTYAPVADLSAYETLPRSKQQPLPTIARANKPKPNHTTNAIPVPNVAVAKWIWPTQGKVLNSFSFFNKGINIAGPMGEPIMAAAAGRIVYCGDGLRGYGNLIIIKHNNLYLSAYAHTQTPLVKEGQWVKQGQKIAEMGNSGTNKVMLHFEIRQAGKPINPLPLLTSSY